MRSLKHSLIVVLTLLFLVTLAACGNPASSSTATSGNQTTYAPKPKASTQNGTQTQPKPPTQQNAPTPTPTATGNQNTTNGGQNTTNMPTDNNNNPGSTAGSPPQNTNPSNGNSQNGGNNGNQQMAGPIYLKVVQASVNGQMTQILTTGTGMTLYYRTSDVAPNAVCSGACAQTWPSLLAQGQIITSMTITSGQLTLQKTANGNQVVYNGHPLYTYVGDKTPGQTNGQGLGNVWLAVSVKTQAAAHW